jgi:hypothetical protein
MSVMRHLRFKRPERIADPIGMAIMAIPRLRHASKWVATLSLVATALVGSATLASPAFASPAGDLGVATNASRASNGLPALALNAQLSTVAQAWADQLAAANVLSHNPALRGQVSDWSVLGENVGLAGDVPTVQAAFMASPPHRANILDPRYTQMGVGSATSIYPSCGCKVLWVVVDFRRPTSVTPLAPKAPTPTKAAVTTSAKTVTKTAVKTPATVVTVPNQTTTVAGVSAGVVAASATALRTQLAASSVPAGASSDPVGRMLNFASVLAQLPA